MKVTLTQGAVLGGKLRNPGVNELSEKDAKDAKELGIVKTDEKPEPKADAKKKAE